MGPADGRHPCNGITVRGTMGFLSGNNGSLYTIDLNGTASATRPEQT